MHFNRIKLFSVAVVLLLFIVLSACSSKPSVVSGSLGRNDFDFHNGSQKANADDDSVYGGLPLESGWSTARGFTHGDSLAKFAELYDGLPCLITVISEENEIFRYTNAAVNEKVHDISRENCQSVSFVFIDDGYTLTFDYSTLNESFTVITRSPKDNGRFQAFHFIGAASQYLMFESYTDMWPSPGLLPWADTDVNPFEYLNERNDTLDQDDRVFMYEKAEIYVDNYSIPLVLEEQREFLSSLSSEDIETFDRVGMQLWNWVQESVKNE